MTSPQKSKGNSWEREAAQFLSKLYGESFVRVPNSGAYIGGSNTHRKKNLSKNQIKGFKGDIIPPDSWKNFNMECKSYKDFPFHQVLQGLCNQLEIWIDQLMEVAEPTDINILCMKFNRKGRFVAVQSKFTWITDQFMYYTSMKHNDWLIMDFELFFKNNKDLVNTYTTKTTETISNKNILNIDTTSNNQV
jgi:hypothetical protein